MDEQDAIEYGQKEACNILGEWLHEEAAWLHHILATYGKCGCVLDVELGHTYCETWRAQQDAWFKEFHGITREQFEAREAKKRDLEARVRAAQRQKSIEEVAAEQGIDPRLLP